MSKLTYIKFYLILNISGVRQPLTKNRPAPHWHICGGDTEKPNDQENLKAIK